MAESGDGSAAPPQRPRLALKPRDPARAAQLEQERLQQAKKSPFGEAKPREKVLASREGKTEEEVLKEEVKKEKLHLRLSPQQVEEKRAHEAAVQEIQDEISLEDDDAKRVVLAAELKARQDKLEALMEGFEKLALETALSGGAPRVSEIRRQQSSGADALGGVPGMPVAGAPAGRYPAAQPYGAGAGAGRGGGRAGFDSYGGPPRQGSRGYGGGRGGGYGDAAGFEGTGGYGGGEGAGAGAGGYRTGTGSSYRQSSGRGFGGGGGYAPPRDDGFGQEFDRQGGGRYQSGGGGGGYSAGGYSGGGGGGGGGYGDSSDAGFFDAPSLSSGGGGGGRRGGRGGRSGGFRDSYGSQGFDSYGGYGNGAQGMGGEINYDAQDRF